MRNKDILHANGDLETVLRYTTKLLLTLLSLIACSYAHTNNQCAVTIHGIEGNMLENVEERLESTMESYQEHRITGNIDQFYTESPEQIKRALQPFGYFHASVTSKINQKPARCEIGFQIHLGHPIRIESIKISATGPGANNPVVTQFIAQFPLHEHQILSIEAYEKAKDDFFEVANNQGYIKATLEKKEIRIDPLKNSAAIILSMNTGPRYYFGNIQFSKNPYATSFLSRFITIKEGSPFSSEALLNLQQDFSSSRYFTSATITPELENEEKHEIPITIDLTAPKAQQYNIGAGYGTFTGPRLNLGMDLRRLTDDGQRLTTQLKLSSVLSGLFARYYIPGHNPLKDQFIVGLNLQRFIPKNGKSFSETLSAGYLTQKNHWNHTFNIHFLNDTYSENDTPIRSSHLLYPSYTISRLAADDIINPHHGSAASLTLQGASENFISTTNFIQGELKGKYITSPTSLSKLILRGDLGYTVVNDLNQLPLTLHFFAGGLNSVRGYPYDSIGPGRYLRVGSIEFQQKIKGNVSAAAFYDIGTASDHFNDPLNRGDGLGLIYTSTIGPIKIYVGRAESKKDKPLSIEFSIGPEF